ncbi:hypothetical protein [Shewanella sp. MBTL60-007]|uniref:hypothetical protein n=1 Tax=Shewanella sp. MBTL60-007 TaxID=2815911 RepID=UPI001BBBEB29|nr:hypothetical protein [Shewanella sp. MBTL60-007]GIU21021.1 hypothetical protein TUM3792_21430 [Shewanella sp. MBTL60-007]
MAFIKLKLIREITGCEIGDMLVQTECIESVVSYNSPLNLEPGSQITMKAVVDGSDDGETYKMQSIYQVAHSVDEIEALIKKAQ